MTVMGDIYISPCHECFVIKEVKNVMGDCPVVSSDICPEVGGFMNRHRSLYQCHEAKVVGYRIICAKGHKLGAAADQGIPLSRMKRGEPLNCAACTGCTDFRRNGGVPPREERGWG